MRKRFFGLLAAAGCLLAGACSQNWMPGTPDEQAEEIDVTFSLSAESGMVSTRAEGSPNESDRQISRGSQIDQLVYAVYIKEKVEKEYGPDEPDEYQYRLLEQYGKGVVGEFPDKEIKAGPGQTILKTEIATLTGAGEKISLRLMRGQEYMIGFWAQSSDCTAYDATDLEAVKIDYLGASNNDETRDAFSAYDSFTARVGEERKVILTRALAQINVGTAGWDWNDEMEYGNLYAYSKIELKGLHNRLNVLTEETGYQKEDDQNEVVSYGWAQLPAYIYSQDKIGTAPDKQEFLTMLQKDEEFLWVKLTADMPDSDTGDKFWGNYLRYNTERPQNQIEDDILTEVFKYLSMCYVLAPKESKATVDVEFYLAETEDGTVRSADGTPENAGKRFSISNVPVQRNYRTNILGGTRGTETTLFNPRTLSLWININPVYDGEHNYLDEKDNDVLNGDVGDKEHNEYPDSDPTQDEQEQEQEQ